MRDHIARFWVMVSRKDTTDNVLVDLDAKGMVYLASNPWTTKSRVAALHLDDCRDEFR
jgi:hypothetical protein